MIAPRADQVTAFRRAAAEHLEALLDLTAQVATIPAPTGNEAARAAFVMDWWSNLRLPGLGAPAIDELHDVVAEVSGRKRGPAVLLAAHLDTVFPIDTALNVRRDADRLHGAGIGDNSLGVAALLMVPRLLYSMNLTPGVPIVLAAPVGEEGLGNLRGMRAVMDRCPDVGGAIAIEGHNLGRVTYAAVGSKRLRVVTTGPGGHSWGDYGRPSAIHVLARLIAELTSVPIPHEPKTSFNVGIIEGGISINTIAPSASMLVDLRSIDANALAEVASEVERIINGFRCPEISVQFQVLGERPAGSVGEDAAIVDIAKRSLTALGITPALDASSTDANIPISRGIPAICLGLTSGGNVHRPDEYVDIAPVADGFAQLAMTTVNLANHLAAGAP
ncbi:MAG TPA: M20/M25/M40 family metallo-hydrolase [Thermomicrobiales bacterium]|nr:M20/M25/M40 family metallo-hydrolase [Thermomicrobiales bacterium]